jgi:hypothetical protein
MRAESIAALLATALASTGNPIKFYFSASGLSYERVKRLGSGRAKISLLPHYRMAAGFPISGEVVDDTAA